MQESKIQSEAFIWARNACPDTHGCLFAVNNNPRNSINGANLKALGLIKGVADMLFFWKGNLYCFEFKTSTGRQSDAQKRWEAQVTRQGAKYMIIRSVDQFKAEFKKIVDD